MCPGHARPRHHRRGPVSYQRRAPRAHETTQRSPPTASPRTRIRPCPCPGAAASRPAGHWRRQRRWRWQRWLGPRPALALRRDAATTEETQRTCPERLPAPTGPRAGLAKKATKAGSATAEEKEVTRTVQRQRHLPCRNNGLVKSESENGENLVAAIAKCPLITALRSANLGYWVRNSAAEKEGCSSARNAILSVI